MYEPCTLETSRGGGFLATFSGAGAGGLDYRTGVTRGACIGCLLLLSVSFCRAQDAPASAAPSAAAPATRAAEPPAEPPAEPRAAVPAPAPPTATAPSTATAPPTATGGRLRGEVRGPDRKPVAGATAIAVRDEIPATLALTSTDARGFLAIDDVPLGSWDVSVYAPGFDVGSVTDLPVGGPFRAVADVALKRGSAVAKPGAVTTKVPGDGGGGPIVVRVVDPSGAPLVRARVALDPVGHRADPALVETGGDGRARVEGLAPGRWRLSVQRAGWARLVVPALDWPGGELHVIARLLPLGDNAPTPVEDLLPPARLIVP